MFRIHHRGSLFTLSLVIAITILAAGCTTPRMHGPSTSTPVTKNRLIEGGAGATEVEAARRMSEAGAYNVVIPRLLQVIQKYPRSNSAQDARYWLGVTYYKIHSYRDAANIFSEYLRSNPHGKFAEDSAAQLVMVRGTIDKEFGTPEQLDEEIKALWEAVKAEPSNYTHKWELASLLWKRGDYDMAGELYANIVEKYPTYATDARLKNRIEFNTDGSYTLLSPQEIQKRQADDQPLVIMNVNNFRSGADLFTREAKYYVVSGQAVNRGESALYGVQINITLFGFGNIVYDTNTVNVGRLNPGETRAFSVRFSNFDTIENVRRHEVTGTFQR